MQLKVMKKINLFLSSSSCQFMIRMILVTSLLVICRQVFASEDPLEGTDASLIATLASGGVGRKFLYLVEGVFATATYIKTKNPMMFGGVVGIAVFLNILFKVAGITG